MTAVNVYPILLVAFLLIGLVSAKSVSSGAYTYEVPRFRLSDLRNGRRASDLKHVLGTTGLLALTLDDDVKTSREVAAHRAAAFDGLCKCATPGQIHDAPLLSVPGTDSATLTDGVTVRTTLATATIGYTPLPLPAAELSSACSSSADTNFADALEGLRDAVAEASSAFINALDGVVSSPTNHPLLKTASGASYNSVRDIVGASKNLEHMHVYSRDNAEAMGRYSNDDVIRLHTDAGLFLSFIPASSCTDIKDLENTDRSFQVLDPHDGQVKVAVFPQDVPSVVIMLGIGAEQWLNTGDQSQNIKLKATRHKVSSMNSGERRAWYGMMHLVPDSAIIQVNPTQRTFSDMRHSVANQRSVATRRFGDDIQNEETDIAIGCGSHNGDSLNGKQEAGDSTRPYRRRLQHVVDGSVCNNVTNFYCWMTCQEIPDFENAAARSEQGQSLYCLDPSVLAGSSDRVGDAVMSCVDYRGVVGAAENPGCVGSWQTTTRGIPSQSITQEEQYLQETYAGDKYCYGSTSMYMHGFQWQGTTCVAYLFPSWVLNTPGKFAAAAIGTIFFGILLEASIYLRRIFTSYVSTKAASGQGLGATGATGKWKYTLASAGTYMVQLTLGYLIMLVIMTYSAPLFIAVIVGLGSGHILFTILRSRQEKKPCPCTSSKQEGRITPEVSAGSSIIGGNSLRQVGLLPLPEGSTPCCMNNILDDGLLQNSALAAPIDDEEESKCDCKVEDDNEEESFTNEFNKSEATTSCCGSAIGNV